jgi:hypothetical protein
MNHQKACEILDLNQKQNIKIGEIKQQYKIYALKYHPDKNKSPNSTEKFQEIHTAYEYLCNNVDSDDDSDTSDKSYSNILFKFLESIIPIDKDSQIMYLIIEKISKVCENKSVDFLEKLDKEVLIKILNLIKMNKEILHINNNYIELIESVINKKSQNDEVIILNPTLEDLFDNNLYKLTVENQTYIVPLWHHELIYENNNRDIYVKCNPILPDNIEIDDINDIHVYKQYSIKELWGKDTFEVDIHVKKIQLEVDKLKLMRQQTIILLKSGISRVNLKNIYDVSMVSTIYIHVTLEL